MVISTSVCTGLARFPGAQWWDPRFLQLRFFYVRLYWNGCCFQANLVDFLLLFVGSKMTWDAAFPSSTTAQDARHRGQCEPEGKLCSEDASLTADSGSSMYLGGFACDEFSRCDPFCGGHAQDAWHLGRFGPEGQYVARRLFRQWHVHGWFCWFDAIHAVFPSVVGMLKMLGTLVGLDEKDSTSLVVFFGKGMCTVGSAGSMQFVLCSLRLSARPLPSPLGRARGVSPGSVVDKDARYCADIGPDEQYTVVGFTVAVLGQGLQARRCAKTGAMGGASDSVHRRVGGHSVWQQRHVRTVVSLGQLRGSFGSPAHRCRAEGVMSTGT